MSDPFRATYRPLSEAEASHLADIKLAAAELQRLYDAAPSVSAKDGDPVADSARRRALALARTNLQQSVFWATHGVTA